MALVGTLTYLENRFVYMETAFVQGSRQLILALEKDPDSDGDLFNQSDRGEGFYRSGGILDDKYLVGILDPVRRKQLGSIPVLNLVYKTIGDIVRGAKLNKTHKFVLGSEVYEHEGSIVEMQNGKYTRLEIKTDAFTLTASFVQKVNVRPKINGKKLVDISSTQTSYNTATFKDASYESLEREGYDMTWFQGKQYIPVHTVEDWDNYVVPRFIEALEKYRVEPDFPYFLFSFDAESTGLFAFSEKHPKRDKAVYFSISFADDEAFGVFLDMQNFTNADSEGIAERITNMTKKDIIEDREITLTHGPKVFKYKRSEICVTGHNFMIDRRFGMTFGADIWFDLCTNQLSFNLDPFLTKRKNGLKYMVTKMLNIEYAELGDICGPKNKGMFKYLSDKRVVMMYGCADTDLQRMVARKLIQIAMDAEEYYGVDHAKQHMELDSIYMNHKADCDYEGMRVDYDAFKKEYDEKVRILDLYYSFMSTYVGRVKTYNDYETLAVAAERHGYQLDPLSAKDIDKSPPLRVSKWTGKEMLDVLFSTLNYPKLVWTQQNKKSKLEGRSFKAKPAINTDALKYYMKFEPTATMEEIDESMHKQEKLEDLKWYATYLKEDFIDPVTKKVLIDKSKFNSFRLPFMYILHAISPIIKSVTAELRPVVESGVEYRFAVCNMTSAVTRRDLNPTQTVSKASKYKYLAYSNDYYYGAVDQSAVEIRILNGLSGDPTLVETLNDPEKDTHTETAALMHQQPAYTISKDTRKNIKKLAFGIPYGKGIFSMCLDLFPERTADTMASTAYLFNLYEEKLAPVIKVLNDVRDRMEDPVNPPQSLKDYLEMDPEKEYGRMINKFGFCQHLEIRKGVEWYIQSLRRKAGNFIIQGFAANLLRKIYLIMLKAFWAKGWIQDRRIRIHLTVHDEIDFSYHKSLNPVEVMSILHETLTVRIKGFPIFYVGINFGKSWGEAKDDEAELPVNLVKELNSKFKNGEYDNYDFGNHLEFFDKERESYFERRLVKELLAINDNKNVWQSEELNDKFTNYTVRSTLGRVAGKPMFELPDTEDPMIPLVGYLPKVIAKLLLPKDDRKHYITNGKKVVQITEKMLTDKYETMEDFFAGVKMKQEEVVESLAIDDDEFEIDLDHVSGIEDSDDMEFDFGEAELDEEEYATDGIVDLDTSFLNTYNDFRDSQVEFVEYGSIDKRIQAEMELASKQLVRFNNFRVSNNKVILPLTDYKTVTAIKKMCMGKTSGSPSAISFFIRYNGSLTNMNKYDKEFFNSVDEFLTMRAQGKAGV